MSEWFRKFIKKDHYPNHYTNIKFKTNFRNCVLDAMWKWNWKESEGDKDTDWDIMWYEWEFIYEVLNHQHL